MPGGAQAFPTKRLPGQFRRRAADIGAFECTLCVEKQVKQGMSVKQRARMKFRLKKASACDVIVQK